MASLTQKKISEAKARLRRADVPTVSLFVASASLASIIAACEHMISVIQAQEDRIDRVEDALQNHLKENYEQSHISATAKRRDG